MDRHSPGGLDFLATPPPGVARPAVAAGRIHSIATHDDTQCLHQMLWQVGAPLR